jgi:Flp pilus assembly pilin Flp
MNFVKNNRGATAVEFALVILPVMFFIIGIMQTAYVVWVDNILHVSVDTAARCGAISSATLPCSGSGLANMQSAARLVFRPVVSGATFGPNSTCTAHGGAGLNATYPVSLFFFHLTLTANSCYPI